MKTSLLKLEIVLVIIGLSILSYAEAWGEDWRSFGVSGVNVGKWFYDEESLIHSSKNIVRVRTNVWTDTSSKEGTDRYVEELKKRFKNLNHVMSLMEVNCADKKTRLLEMTGYFNQTVLGSIQNPKKDWSFIAPGSRDEALYKAICK